MEGGCLHPYSLCLIQIGSLVILLLNIPHCELDGWLYTSPLYARYMASRQNFRRLTTSSGDNADRSGSDGSSASR